MAPRAIIAYDCQTLRQPSEPVRGIDDSLRMLLDDLAQTMYRTPNGGGISACQVGVRKRALVVDVDGKPLKLLNPVVLEQEGLSWAIEGCLSFPGILGVVKRPRKIIVRAFNEWGREVTLHAKGALAQCLSHELDHLEGLLFLDRAAWYLPGHSPAQVLGRRWGSKERPASCEAPLTGKEPPGPVGRLSYKAAVSALRLGSGQLNRPAT